MNAFAIKFNKIKTMSVVGGFLDGFDLNFNDGLNCLIGPRGTGKTTVLEFIRYTLNAFPEGDRGAGIRKRVENLIKSNLGDGRIRVIIETKDGLEYTVDRTSSGEPIVLTISGEPTDISLKSGCLFSADIFSQNEVEDIADNSCSQLMLLDSFVQDEIRALEQSIRHIQDELRANANKILPLQKKQFELLDQLNTLPQVEAKIKSFEQIGGDNAAEINNAHLCKALRDRESIAIANIIDFLHQYASGLKELAERFSHNTNAIFPDNILGGPNGELFKQICSELDTCDAQKQKHFEALLVLIKVQFDSIIAKGQELKIRQDRQEIEFRNVIEKHKEAQGQATERAKWEQKRNELLSKKQAYDEAIKLLDQLLNERQKLLACMSEFMDKRFARRLNVAEFITNNIASPVRVRLAQFGNKINYETFLADCLKTAGINHRVVASRICASVSPAELGNIVRQNMTERLLELADINQSQAEKVIKFLNTSEHLLALEAIELVDLPTIELRDGTEYKNSLYLSTGQKCTTILPILLLESENPLLVDQPEDNLDNRFIFETVVDGIHKVKQRRQMIFITHNPNIPVLGEASQVFVLTSDGVKACVSKSGSVDDCKNDIIDLLEGGKEAFLRRKERYNY